jgi:hypothetical protein
MYAAQNIQEDLTIKQGRYFWLFVALVSVFLIYFMVDCFNLFGGDSDEGDCGCAGELDSSVRLSTST